MRFAGSSPRSIFVVASIIVIALAGALAISLSNRGEDSIVSQKDLRDAAAFSRVEFQLYYLGTEYDGESLTDISRSKDGEHLTGRTFLYGDCEPEGEVIFGIEFVEGGCPLPFQIQNTHICVHKPQVTRHPAAGKRMRIRGVPAFQYREGQLDIYAGDTTIGIEAPAQDSARKARQAANDLRSVDGGIKESNPLPRPSARALEGKLKCPRME